MWNSVFLTDENVFQNVIWENAADFFFFFQALTC